MDRILEIIDEYQVVDFDLEIHNILLTFDEIIINMDKTNRNSLKTTIQSRGKVDIKHGKDYMITGTFNNSGDMIDIIFDRKLKKGIYDCLYKVIKSYLNKCFIWYLDQFKKCRMKAELEIDFKLDFLSTPTIKKGKKGTTISISDNLRINNNFYGEMETFKLYDLNEHIFHQYIDSKEWTTIEPEEIKIGDIITVYNKKDGSVKVSKCAVLDRNESILQLLIKK